MSKYAEIQISLKDFANTLRYHFKLDESTIEQVLQAAPKNMKHEGYFSLVSPQHPIYVTKVETSEL